MKIDLALVARAYGFAALGHDGRGRLLAALAAMTPATPPAMPLEGWRRALAYTPGEWAVAVDYWMDFLNFSPGDLWSAPCVPETLAYHAAQAERGRAGGRARGRSTTATGKAARVPRTVRARAGDGGAAGVGDVPGEAPLKRRLSAASSGAAATAWVPSPPPALHTSTPSAAQAPLKRRSSAASSGAAATICGDIATQDSAQGDDTKAGEGTKESGATASEDCGAAARFVRLDSKDFRILLESISGERWSPTEDQVAAWRAAYPALDLPSEFARMAAWLAANPSRGKTTRGLPRFANSWLARSAADHVPQTVRARPQDAPAGDVWALPPRNGGKKP